MKRTLKHLLTAAMASVLLLAMASCGTPAGSGESSGTVGDTPTGDLTFQPGVFSNYVDCYGMAGYVSSLETGYGTENTLFERNTLVLTDNPESDRNDIATAVPFLDTTTTKRYELTKELYVGSRGIHRIAMYYGTYTADGMNVTLSTPEYWSYVDYEGDGYYSFNKMEVCDFMVRTGEQGNSGDLSMKFNGPVLPPFADTSNAPQTVIVNMADYTFEFPAGDTSDDVPAVG